MALKVTNGRPVPVSAINILGGRTLEAPLIKQEQTQWCWAACMQMGFRLFNPADTKMQCELANAAFELTGCCSAPTSSLCNSPLPVLSVSPEWSRHDYRALYTNQAVEFSTLRTEIDQGRPVETGIKWSRIGGHAVLVVGYNMVETEELVLVHDPWEGLKSILHSELKSAYGRGQWMWTWTGIRPD